MGQADRLPSEKRDCMNDQELFEKIAAGLGKPLLPTDLCLRDPEGNVIRVMRSNKLIWFVDMARVNIGDLIAPCRPGKIVRCAGKPQDCIMVYDIGDDTV